MPSLASRLFRYFQIAKEFDAFDFCGLACLMQCFSVFIGVFLLVFLFFIFLYFRQQLGAGIAWLLMIRAELMLGVWNKKEKKQCY